MSVKQEDIKARAEKVLALVRPYLQIDKGDVEYVKFEEETGTCEVRLLGNCASCPLSMMTLRAGIERYLLKHIPEIRRVEAVK